MSSADSGTDKDPDGSTQYRLVNEYTLVAGGHGRSSSGVMENAATLNAHGSHLVRDTLDKSGPGACCDVFNYRRE